MRSFWFRLVALSAWALVTVAPVAAAPSDIVSPGSGLTLGTGWYLHETAAGNSFRWVANNAQIVVNRPIGSVKKIAIVAEAGPGLGQPKMTVHVLDRAGKEVERFNESLTEKDLLAAVQKAL